MTEREETGGHHVGWRKPRVTNSPWGREVIAPFTGWCVNHQMAGTSGCREREVRVGLAGFAMRSELSFA